MRFLRVAALTGATLIGLGLSAAIAEECPQKGIETMLDALPGAILMSAKGHKQTLRWAKIATPTDSSREK
jgi:hypothetical protein